MKSIASGVLFAGVGAWLVTCCMVQTAIAAQDKAPAQIGANDWDFAPVRFWYIPTTTPEQRKPTAVQWKVYTVDAGFIATHCQTDEGHGLNHYHYERDFDHSPYNGNGPSDFQADDYWDVRFSDAVRQSSATNKLDCHTWAFKTYSTANGAAQPSYEYASAPRNWGTAYADDRGPARQNNNQVAADDFLVYAATDTRADHTSVVDGVRDAPGGGKQPQYLKWKWGASGVYRFQTPTNGTTQFDTPMCHGSQVVDSDVDSSRIIFDQGWSWDLEYHSNLLGVYPND